jgi:hypothetical protein
MSVCSEWHGEQHRFNPGARFRRMNPNPLRLQTES